MAKQRLNTAVMMIALLGLVGPRAQALFGLPKWPFSHKEEPVKRGHRDILPGQKMRVFKLEKVKSEDVVELLQTYLDSTHNQGSVISDPTANSLIVTTDPEEMLAVETLMRETDRVYNSPTPRGRQVLVAQQLFKAIRSLGTVAKTGSGVSRTVASTRSATPASPQAPIANTYAGVPPPLQPEASTLGLDVSRTTGGSRRILDERPPLLGFHLIGWVRDNKGLIVVLRNGGQRYVFRHGRILYGGLGSPDSVPGMTGLIQGEHLILRDGTHGMVTLSMNPRRDEKGDLR